MKCAILITRNIAQMLDKQTDLGFILLMTCIQELPQLDVRIRCTSFTGTIPEARQTS
jgi:hypothetical protein